MKRSMTIAVPVLALSTLLFSCKKADTLPQATSHHETAKITINTPYENQLFSAGDTVFVKAFVTCATEMHGCSVYIIRNNADTLFTKAQHMHGKEMMVSEQWVNNQGTPGDLQVVVSAVIDHDGATADKAIAFKAQ
ncbi:MAG: hypothetical protein H3C54_00295 [Taibaiella sp.]|nr:hypothetical protein [Taibaiella sp.]